MPPTHRAMEGNFLVHPTEGSAVLHASARCPVEGKYSASSLFRPLDPCTTEAGQNGSGSTRFKTGSQLVTVRWPGAVHNWQPTPEQRRGTILTSRPSSRTLPSDEPKFSCCAPCVCLARALRCRGGGSACCIERLPL
jgi:hypothetical protein